MNYSPRISVIIPALNEEKLIRQTLSQFTPGLKEKYKIEVIVSDGGSKDNTLHILAPETDVIVTFDGERRQNIPEGRNAGSNMANGDILIFLNADTLIRNTEDFFSHTIEVMSNPDILACTCKIRVFPHEEKLADKLFHSCYNAYVKMLNLLGMGMGRGECHIVRKDVFTKIKGYNEKLSAGEDYDLFRRIRKLGRIKFLSKLVVYESPRRYRKYGYVKVFGDWTKNSLSVFFRNKSVSDEWEAVR